MKKKQKIVNCTYCDWVGQQGSRRKHIKTAHEKFIQSDKLEQFNLLLKKQDLAKHFINDIETFLKKNYHQYNKIGQGSYGTVYSAVNNNKKHVAIKFCHKNHDDLKKQYGLYLKFHKKISVPQPFKHDLLGTNISYLQMQLLGSSLRSVQKNDNMITQKSMLMIIVQLINIIKMIHQNGVIHSDIKASNICFGLGKTASQIFVIDLGLSQKFIKKQQSIRSKGYNGTASYVSMGCHLGKNPSWKDDLQSIVYLSMELVFGKLPWNNIAKCFTHPNRSAGIAQLQGDLEAIKIYCTYPYLITSLLYCRNLKYGQVPNYDYFSSLFRTQLTENYISDLVYEWNQSITANLKLGKSLLLDNLQNHCADGDFLYKIESKKSTTNIINFFQKKNSILSLKLTRLSVQKKCNNIEEVINLSNRIFIREYFVQGNFLNISSNLELCDKQLNQIICWTIQHQTFLPLQIKQSKMQGAGLGLFTTTLVPRLSLICVYLGRICDDSNLPKGFDSIFTLGWIHNKNKKTSRQMFIDSQKYTNVGRYINGKYGDSQQNCLRIESLAFFKGSMVPVILIYSKTQIANDTELIYDYGAVTYWKQRQNYIQQQKKSLPTIKTTKTKKIQKTLKLILTSTQTITLGENKSIITGTQNLIKINQARKAKKLRMKFAFKK